MGPGIRQENVLGPFALVVAAPAGVAQEADRQGDNGADGLRRGTAAMGKQAAIGKQEDEAIDTSTAVEFEVDHLA